MSGRANFLKNSFCWTFCIVVVSFLLLWQAWINVLYSGIHSLVTCGSSTIFAFYIPRYIFGGHNQLKIEQKWWLQKIIKMLWFSIPACGYISKTFASWRETSDGRTLLSCWKKAGFEVKLTTCFHEFPKYESTNLPNTYT